VINDSPLVWIVNNAPAWSPEATAQESVSVQAFRLAVEELWGPAGTLAIEPNHIGYFESQPGDPWPWLSVHLGTQGVWEAATRGAKALEDKAPSWAASSIKNRSPGGYAVVKCAIAGNEIANKLADPSVSATSGYLKLFLTGVSNANSCREAVQYANQQEPRIPRQQQLALADFDAAKIKNAQLLQRGETALAENVKASTLQRAGQTVGRLVVKWLSS